MDDKNKVLFKVINTQYIHGQWLTEGQVFDVMILSENKGVLRDELGINSFGDELPFECIGIATKNRDQIFSAIKYRFNRNIFKIYEDYVVDLI